MHSFIFDSISEILLLYSSCETLLAIEEANVVVLFFASVATDCILFIASVTTAF